MEKLLSIFIPTYNMEKYLRKCLDSLLVSDENMQRLEVLVINDGSKDSSSQIAHEYEAKYPQTFRVIDKENGNYGSCINRGLKEATGKYVKVLDADDYFDTKVFDGYLTFLVDCTADMVLTDYYEVNENGRITRKVSIPYPHGDILRVSDCCENRFFVDLQMHAVTYRRELLIQNNYVQTTGVSYTDQEWVFMPITYMNTFCHYQGALYQYLVGREGQTIDKAVSSKQAKVRFGLIFKRIDYYNQAATSVILDDKKLSFLKRRLLHSIYSMYKVSLIFGDFSEDLIEEFDNDLKLRHKSIYDETASSALCRCKNIEFIAYWRNKGDVPFRIKLIRLFKRFLH